MQLESTTLWSTVAEYIEFDTSTSVLSLSVCLTSQWEGRDVRGRMHLTHSQQWSHTYSVNCPLSCILITIRGLAFFEGRGYEVSWGESMEIFLKIRVVRKCYEKKFLVRKSYEKNFLVRNFFRILFLGWVHFFAVFWKIFISPALIKMGGIQEIQYMKK